MIGRTMKGTARRYSNNKCPALDIHCSGHGYFSCYADPWWRKPTPEETILNGDLSDFPIILGEKRGIGIFK
jgi:hypothetical protein